MSAKLKPLYDRVVVKRAEEERKSAGGIVIPDTATGEKPCRGKVIAIGQGKLLENGTLRPVGVKAGDTILFGKYSGTEVKIGSDELVVMREDDIMAIIEE